MPLTAALIFEWMFPCSYSPVSGITVDYIVMEEGVYTVAQNGLNIEVVKYDSSVTDCNASWVGEPRSYANTYIAPVVLGQVMTSNDPDWSVFWCRGAEPSDPPSATGLYTGKHVAEDPDATRATETIGYIVSSGT